MAFLSIGFSSGDPEADPAEVNGLIMQQRDADRYKVKEMRKKQLGTLVGDVEYERRYYYDTEEEYGLIDLFKHRV